MQANSSMITPCWHSSRKSIEQEPIPDWKKPDFTRDIIFTDINLLDLINSFHSKLKLVLRESNLDNPLMYEERTSKIIESWKNKRPLMPPMIVLNDNIHEVTLVDGKHRINVAFCLGAHSIPITLSGFQLNNEHPFLEKLTWDKILR